MNSENNLPHLCTDHNQALIPHLQSQNIKDIQESLKLGDKHYDQGRFSEAYETYNKLLQSLPTRTHSYSESELILLHRKLGIAALGKADYKQAYDFLTKGFELVKVSDNDPLEAARFRLSTGEVFLAQDKYIEALESFKAALEVFLKQNKDASFDIAICYNNLGELYKKQGKYTGALKYQEKAIKMIPQDSMEKLELSTSYYHMGNIYKYLADFVQASLLIEKSLKIREEQYGDKHPEIATCHNMIGNIWLDQGKYHEALKSYDKTLEIRLDFLGESHPSVASCFNNIGIALFELGNYEEALSNHQKAFKIRKNCFGESHPDVAASLNNIAAVFYDQMKFRQALEYYNQALNIRRQFYGENHPDVAASYNNIGNVFQEQQDFEKAQNNLMKSLEIKIKHFGAKHPEVATSHNNLATIYHNRQEYYPAFTNFIKSLRIRLNFFGVGHYEVADSYFNLGLLLQEVKNLEFYGECNKKSTMVYKRILERNHTNVRDSRAQIELAEKKRCVLDLNQDCSFWGKSMKVWWYIGDRIPEIS